MFEKTGTTGWCNARKKFCDRIDYIRKKGGEGHRRLGGTILLLSGALPHYVSRSDIPEAPIFISDNMSRCLATCRHVHLFSKYVGCSWSGPTLYQIQNSAQCQKHPCFMEEALLSLNVLRCESPSSTGCSKSLMSLLVIRSMLGVV